MNNETEFWSNVAKQSSDNCWNWTRAVNAKGYGRLGYQGKSWRAHRLAYYLTYGEIPKGILVCHKCDNPPCCNPEHLFLGTDLENTTDKIQKNRAAYSLGVINGANKLTEQQVRDIRAEHATGTIGYKRLGLKYGVHAQTISDIVRDKIWRWVV
jgi:hypothetical protein